jgi:NADPH-dependent glutamate synthase beta chain and related oxidoreductases
VAVLQGQEAGDLWEVDGVVIFVLFTAETGRRGETNSAPLRLCGKIYNMAINNNRLSQGQYAENFSDIHPPFENKDAALVEANRCLFCYDAPCMKSCPTGINVSKFIKQIATENIKGSAHTILVSNIMGAGCSRVCPVEKLCEGACVYNFLEETPIAIAKLQRYATEIAMQQNWQLFERKPSNGKKLPLLVQALPG